MEHRVQRHCGGVDTVVALSQHTYWNLNANINNVSTVLEHSLQIDADHFLGVDKHLIPTGDILPTQEAPWLNFAVAKAIGKDISQGTVTPFGGYDNAFVFSNWTRGQSPVARVAMSSSLTRIALTLVTDQPSVQFYSGNFLDGTIPRKSDQCTGAQPEYYERFGTAVLEAQYFPDAVHQPNFPSITLRAGETYTQKTSYILSTF